MPESNTSYGAEIRTGTTLSTPCIDSTSNGVILSAGFIYGMVPVKTLGLSNLVGKDGFNTKLSYIIDQRFANAVDSSGTNGFEGSDPNINMINIKELSILTGPVIMLNGIMVIISHGPNKLGGFNSSGTSQNSPSNATNDEKDNAINSFVASPLSGNFDNTFITNSTDSLFDDVLIFKNKMQLAIDAGFENMMCRGITESLLCYDNTGLSSNLIWPSANYGEFKTTSSSCPAGCTNKLSGYPARKCGKYGIWNKVIYPCYNLTSPS